MKKVFYVLALTWSVIAMPAGVIINNTNFYIKIFIRQQDSNPSRQLEVMYPENSRTLRPHESWKLESDPGAIISNIRIGETVINKGIYQCDFAIAFDRNSGFKIEPINCK